MLCSLHKLRRYREPGGSRAVTARIRAIKLNARIVKERYDALLLPMNCEQLHPNYSIRFIIIFQDIWIKWSQEQTADYSNTCIFLGLCSVGHYCPTATTHWTNFGERYRRTGCAQDMEDVRACREQKPYDPVCSLIPALAPKFLHALLTLWRLTTYIVVVPHR